jgi:hypothetical protein
MSLAVNPRERGVNRSSRTLITRCVAPHYVPDEPARDVGVIRLSAVGVLISALVRGQVMGNRFGTTDG